MSCYHPLLGVYDGRKTVNGKPALRIVSQPKDPISAISEFPGSVLVPCGRCIGCRLDYSRRWADRMMLELETSGSAVFVTLTYDDDHIPIASLDEDDLPYTYTLDKRDAQLFMKSLRKEFEPRRIRFYLSGEYGDRTFRPHLHAILFGLSLDDFPDRVPWKVNKLGDPYYLSDRLSNIWKRGHVLLCNVSWATCAYVSRYVMKKCIKSNTDIYAAMNCEPEFATMSRKPGLGADYLALHPDALDYTSINLSTPQGGLKISVPKYYVDKMSLTDPVRFDKLKLERRVFAQDKALLKLQQTDNGYYDMLRGEELSKEASLKALKRNSM